MWREMVLLMPGSLYVHWAYFIPMLRLKSKSIVSQFVSRAFSDLHFKVLQGRILKGILTLSWNYWNLSEFMCCFSTYLFLDVSFQRFLKFLFISCASWKILHSSVGIFFPFLSVAFRLFDLRQTGFIEREEVWYFWDHNKKKIK